jgi:hypothetical protein
VIQATRQSSVDEPLHKRAMTKPHLDEILATRSAQGVMHEAMDFRIGDARDASVCQFNPSL